MVVSGCPSVHYRGFSSRGFSVVGHRLQQLRREGSIVVAQGLSCPVAGIFPDQDQRVSPALARVDSRPLSHQGRPWHHPLREVQWSVHSHVILIVSSHFIDLKIVLDLVTRCPDALSYLSPRCHGDSCSVSLRSLNPASITPHSLLALLLLLHARALEPWWSHLLDSVLSLLIRKLPRCCWAHFSYVPLPSSDPQDSPLGCRTSKPVPSCSFLNASFLSFIFFFASY